jgi:hypothetical protein
MNTKINIVLVVCCLLLSNKLKASNYPTVTIANNTLEMMLFVPDSATSYYQASRFDWGSVVGQVTYKGNTYLQQWHNYNGRGPEAPHDPLTPNTATGLAEEFMTGLGFDEAPVNGSFVKIGVGVLQKPDTAAYNFATAYKILDTGKRSMQQTATSLTFTHELQSEIGYAYELIRVYTLIDNKLMVSHSLRNTGKKRIVTETYSHNFMQFNYEAYGPGYSLEFLNSTIDTKNHKWITPKRVKINDKSIDIVGTFPDFVPTFGMMDVHTGKGDFRLINRNNGMSVNMEVDRKVSSFVAWMWQKAFSAEPRITIDVKPGKTVKWNYIYTFNTPNN